MRVMALIAQMEVHMFVMPLILLALLGLVFVVGIAGLLTHEKTRPLGAVVLGVPVTIALVVLLFRTGGLSMLGASREALVMPWWILLLMVGGIAAVVSLLANRKSRPVALVVVGVPLVAAALAFGLLFAYETSTNRGGSQIVAIEQPAEAEPWSSGPRVIPLDAPPATASTVEVALEDQKKPGKKADAKKTTPAAVPAAEKPPKPADDADTPPAAEKPPKPADDADTPPAPATPKRPDWVEAKPKKIGDAYQVVATVGPYTTRLECDQALPAQLQEATAEYVGLYLGPEAQRRANLSNGYLTEHVLKDQFEETIESSVGPMIQLHSRLEFNADANKRLNQNWHDARVQQRLWWAGGGLAAVLAVLAGMFTVMKIDLATKGAYRGRMVLAAVLLMVLGLGLLMIGSVFFDRAVSVQSDSHQVTAIEPVGHAVASSESVTASASGGEVRPSLFALALGMLTLILLTILLWHKNTRPIGLVLLVVVAVGAVLVIG